MNKKVIYIIRKNLLQIKKQLIFKSSHISFGWKIALLWAWISLISLFFPWVWSLGTIISSGDVQIHSFSSFANVLGRIGFFIAATLWIIIFSIFSIQKKEKLRYFSLLHISDYISSLIGSIFIFILSIHSLFLIWGLKIFSSNIIHWKGIILSITWSLVILAGALIMKQEYRKNIKWSYINDVTAEKWQQVPQVEKSNMKLPF